MVQVAHCLTTRLSPLWFRFRDWPQAWIICRVEFLWLVPRNEALANAIAFKVCGGVIRDTSVLCHFNYDDLPINLWLRARKSYDLSTCSSTTSKSTSTRSRSASRTSLNFRCLYEVFAFKSFSRFFENLVFFMCKENKQSVEASVHGSWRMSGLSWRILSLCSRIGDL